MAKTLDEEKAEKKGYGGVSAADIKTADGDFRQGKEKMAKIAGDIGDRLKKFEDKGGDKKALKLASAINNMEIENSVSFFNHLQAYLDVLGFFDQLDLFEKTREQQLNKESIAQASKPGKASEPHAAVN